MNTQGASMKKVRTPSRLAHLFALALLASPSLAGLAGANHNSNENGILPDQTVTVPGGDFFGLPPVTLPLSQVGVPDWAQTVRDSPDTITALDHARDEVVARMETSIGVVRAELERRNATPEALLPSNSARVLEDHVDEGRRIGGVGPWTLRAIMPTEKVGWRIVPDAGPDGSAAFTVADPETGKYPSVDMMLVSPVLDLSAYPLMTGTLPYAGGNLSVPPNLFCQRPEVPSCGLDISASYIRDLITLTFRHRYNLVFGEDGGQVLVFDYDPAGDADGYPIRPMTLYGNYSLQPVNGLTRQHGFTGDSGGWETTAFDLTPWAGKKIWVAFRFGAGTRASGDPDYFPSAFSTPAPYGWTIDDIEVRALAYGQNLKVYSIDGPSFRRDEKDKLDRTPPGQETHVGATVLNAGSNVTLANLTLTVRGLDGEDVVRTFSRRMEAGEVWNVTIPVVAPVQEGTNFTVDAIVRRPPSVGAITLPDPTQDDNRLSRTFTASAVVQHEMTLRPAEAIVDDNAPQAAIVTVRNTGNVPLTGFVDLWERYNATNASTGVRDVPTSVTHDPKPVSVAPGATVELPPWAVTTGTRGEHRLVANLTVVDGPSANRTVTYHVHASPPPAFAAGGEDGIPEGWDTYVAKTPVDSQDGWAWRSMHTTPSRILRGLIVPEAAGGQYDRLHLKVRYFGDTSAMISIVVSHPAPSLPGEEAITMWSIDRLPAPTVSAKQYVEIATSRSWAIYETDIQLDARNGSIDLWGAGALEIRVATVANSPPLLLDDLRLTAVPVGKDEAHRMEIVRITGNPANALTETPVQPSTDAPPSSCPTFVNVGLNCWERVTDAELRAQALGSRWQVDPPRTFANRDIVLLYTGSPGDSGIDTPDRIVTPVINLSAATDPVIFLDHAYAFQGFPHDSTTPPSGFMSIRQIGITEIQYLRDDGTWSKFYRIQPVGGHRAVLGQTDDGMNRGISTLVGSQWPDKAGFFWPTACRLLANTQETCDQGGYYNNVFEGRLQWRQWLPTPWSEVAVFRLNDQLPGVDLTNRPIRLALQATENPSKSPNVETSQWNVLGLRVTPVSRFAIDASVSNITPKTDYDWTELGIAPGTAVPVNVTVTNEGLFAEDFSVNLGVSELGGTTVWGNATRVGLLGPGESLNVTIPWNLSAHAGRRNHVLSAYVNTTSNRTADENRFNDRASLGTDGKLFSQEIRDAGVRLQGFPQRGDVGVLRYLPITVHNLGNVELAGLSIERTIEFLDPAGARTVSRTTFPIGRPLGPTGPISITLASPGVRDSEMTFLPADYGTYLVTLRILKDGARMVGDATPDDNEARVFLEASEPIVQDGFDERVRWTTDAGAVWGEGPGFQSQGALTAMNRTSGLLPAEIDASAVSPRLSLADARTAIVNFVARYELEAGYDGVVVEVSNDNRTWRRAGPLDELGRPGLYPARLTASNPLVADPANDNATAFTGSSASLPANLEGWAPFSFDLATVPGVGESVVFSPLPPPKYDGSRIKPDEDDKSISSAEFMKVDPSRWEIRNEQYSADEDYGGNAKPGGDGRFWSNMTWAAGTVTLAREFNFTRLGVSPSSMIVAHWWDRRPGTLGSDWRGVGAEYYFRYNNVTVPAELVQRGADGWNLVKATLPENVTRDHTNITVRFDVVKGPPTTAVVSASNVGWEVRGIRIESVPALNGAPIPGRPPLKSLTGDENETDERKVWFDHSLSKNSAPAKWGWVTQRHPIPAAPWNVTIATGPDGRPRDVWKLTLDKDTRVNVDARLVGPIVDLSEVGGGAMFLRLVHKYDLLHDDEGIMNQGTLLTDNKYYQAGTVEVEVWNRTTSSWDPPRQVWRNGVGPTRDLLLRPTLQEPDPAGAPYTRTLLDAGDTFQRFPRTYNQKVGANAPYYRLFDFNASYAFSGLSAPGDGWVTDEFDLSPFRGEKVRVVFHAWSGPKDPADKSRYWMIGDANVVGNVMSANDVYLRFRLGTDGSILPGTFAADQFEVSGTRYERSVAIQLASRPEAVNLTGSVTVSGRIQNHGPGIRDNLAVGIQIVPITGTTAPVPLVTVLGDNLTSPPTGFVRAMGPFRLGPAGGSDSHRNFTFQIHAGDAPGNFTVRLVLLEAIEAFVFEPAQDDVPGRARREWTLELVDAPRAALDPIALSPRSQAAPGPVHATLSGVNNGTTRLKLSAVFTWRDDGNGTIMEKRLYPPAESPPVSVQPGGRFSLPSPPVTLPPGNYTLTVELLNGGARLNPAVEALARYRVQRSDVVYQASFENGLAGWSFQNGATFGTFPPEMFRLTREQALFGNVSLQYGLRQIDYDFGNRIEDFDDPASSDGGRILSPIIDLKGATNETWLGFWKKSSLLTLSGQSNVIIAAQRVDSLGEAIPNCGPIVVTPVPPLRVYEVDSDWSYVQVPLVGGSPTCTPSGGLVRLLFQFNRPAGKDWVMDGVTIFSGKPAVTPQTRLHDVSDGGEKAYTFVVRNTGSARREYEPVLARNQSLLTNDQTQWVRVSPERFALEPNATAVVTVRVAPPSSRSHFEQPLNVSIALREALMPFALNLLRVDLGFKPQDRADLAAIASIDGTPLTAARLGVEEGTPHEVGVLVSNLGLVPSKPTDVVLRIVNASGGVEWEHREPIDAVLPVVDGGEAALVTAVWKPAYGKRGNVSLLVSVDPDRRQVDYDRSNGDLSLPLSITPLIRPDLVVDPRAMRITTPTGQRLHEAEPGQLVRIGGVVRNDGLAEAKQVTVRIIAGSSVLKEETVASLKVGDAILVGTNQIAPPTSTTYQIVALTPDLEINPDNNAQSLELPILPPELLVSTAEPELRLEPGLKRVVTMNVTNTAPYPTTLNLSLGPGARYGSLGASRLALGPLETRSFTLTLTPGERELAGETLLPVVVDSSEGIRARRTLTLHVEERPAASLLPYLARGPPQSVRIEMDVVNDGNVELKPFAVVRDAQGKDLLRKDLPAVPPGKSRFATLTLELPDDTPPGLAPASLLIESRGEVLAQQPLALEVKPWGRLLARATPGLLEDGRQDVAITVSYEGNAPTLRTPVVFNAPEGVVARYSEESLALAPGDTRSLTLRIAAPRAAPNGLYQLQAGFLDPEEGTAALLGNLTAIPLDLRRAKTELAFAERATSEPVGGAPVEYVARVRNVGDLEAALVPVDLYVDGALVDRKAVEGLAPGESREVRLTWRADSGRHAIVLAVDADAQERSAAFAETLDVAKGAVEGVAGLSPVPAPGPLLFLAALALAALALRRRGRDP